MFFFGGIAGFGLGALNDADEDDLDVYDNARGGRGGRRHQAYDINERDDEDDDRIVIGQSRERGRTHPEQVSLFRIHIDHGSLHCQCVEEGARTNTDVQ